MNGHALRIYAHATRPDPLPRPRPAAATIAIVEHRLPANDALACEPQVLAIFAAPAEPNETIEVAYRRKERELAGIFSALTTTEARTLHRRLSEPRTDDALAQGFARLVIDRRQRLLAILADAPRREARRR